MDVVWDFGSGVLLVCIALAAFYVFFVAFFGKNPYVAEISPNVNLGVSATATGAARFVMVSVPWCPYCKQAKPVWAGIHDKFHDTLLGGKKLSVEFIDAEKDKTSAKAWKVTAYPTFLLVTDKKIVRYRGPPRRDTLELFLTKNLE